MQLDKEEHREILLLAVSGMPISGPAGDPQMLRHVTLVHELLGAIGTATVASVPEDPARAAAAEMMESR